MNPLQTLIQTLNKRPTTTGTVSVVNSSSSVTVSTFRGPQVCTLAMNTPIKPGDKVALNGNQIVSKLRSDDEIPHYIVGN